MQDLQLFIWLIPIGVILLCVGLIIKYKDNIINKIKRKDNFVIGGINIGKIIQHPSFLKGMKIALFFGILLAVFISLGIKIKNVLTEQLIQTGPTDINITSIGNTPNISGFITLGILIIMTGGIIHIISTFNRDI